MRTFGVHFGVVEIRVAGVEQPAALQAHGDAGMAQRVAEQRHERQVERGNGLHAIEAVPLLARARLVRAPILA